MKMHPRSSSKKAGTICGKRRKLPKCTRGKKICPNCISLMPIHCFKCTCGHQFTLKRKHKEDTFAVIPVPQDFKPHLPLSFDSHKCSPFEMYVLKSKEIG